MDIPTSRRNTHSIRSCFFQIKEFQCCEDLITSSVVKLVPNERLMCSKVIDTTAFSDALRYLLPRRLRLLLRLMLESWPQPHRKLPYSRLVNAFFKTSGRFAAQVELTRGFANGQTVEQCGFQCHSGCSSVISESKPHSPG